MIGCKCDQLIIFCVYSFNCIGNQKENIEPCTLVYIINTGDFMEFLYTSSCCSIYFYFLYSCLQQMLEDLASSLWFCESQEKFYLHWTDSLFKQNKLFIRYANISIVVIYTSGVFFNNSHLECELPRVHAVGLLYQCFHLWLVCKYMLRDVYWQYSC